MLIPESEQVTILSEFAEQLREWDLKMPSVEPLIMDFGLGDFSKVGLIEYWIANEIQAGYCGKYLFLFDTQQCPFHSHRQKHETFFVVKGTVRMIANDSERIMNTGDVLIMPPGDIHSFYGIGNALILEISTPCLLDDNYFQDGRIAEWLKKSI